MLLTIATLLVILAMLIQTEWAQNFVINKVTTSLSKTLATTIKVKRVSISLLNRMYLEGTLIEDQQKDTLLYAGALKISITDWFFLQNQAELHYIGLDNALINFKRTDSVWNYQFIADYLSSGPRPKEKKENGIEFLIKRAEFNNVRLNQVDGWVGEDRKVSIGYLNLTADEINFAKKKIFLNRIELNNPVFSIYNYKGTRPPRIKSKKAKINVEGLQWNVDDWDILLTELVLKNGRFKNDILTDREVYNYFDGAHIDFKAINLTAKNISWQKDTISGQLNMSANERSGFEVTSMKANLKLYPEAMIFRDLDIRTPTSHLSNYYSMRFEDFNRDMSEFLTSVRLEGRFVNSTISSKDIAYFAPDLNRFKTSLKINGNVSGTIDNLYAKRFTIQYGKNTFLDGDIRMKGLPDIEQTYIDFRSNDFRTTYNDALTIVPSLSEISEPRLQELQYVRFKGSYNGFIRDFVTNGTIETALGNVNADIHLKIPVKGSPSYAGRIETQSFHIGKFIGDEKLGAVAFNGQLNGTGFDPLKANSEVNGTITSFEWNNYVYRNVALNGTLKQKEFIGEGSIDDPHLKAGFNGSFNLNTDQPEYNLIVDIQRGNLMDINFSKVPIDVLGKFRLNFKGKSIDEFIGEASLYDVALTKSGQTFVFDTLYLYSMKIEDNKQIEINNSDINISLFGVFNILDLPQTFTSYLSKYYPMYFTEPKVPIHKQDFTFTADLKNIDQYLPLFDSKLNGLDYSKINGKINTTEKSLILNAYIPYLSYEQYELNDFALDANGDMDSLRIIARAGIITVNDSLQFPSTSLSIRSSANVSAVNFNTAANQTINAATLSATLTNLKDGVRIHFNPSSVVLNDKTWRIEEAGELTISRSILDATDIRMTNGEQEISVSTVPSAIGNSNDIAVSLKRVNMGDILPFVMKEPRIEGITSGDLTIEDPYNKLKVYLNAQTDQTRFEGDSIGITTLNAFWDNDKRKATYFLTSDNKNYDFGIEGSLDLADSLDQRIEADFKITEAKLTILEKYLAGIFTDVKGLANGNLTLSGKLQKPSLTGSVKLTNGGMKVAYTQCYYDFVDPTIVFKPGVIDFGEIKILDKDGNPGIVKGTLKHSFFRDFEYDISASSDKMLLLNTTRLDNADFFGKAIGKVNFSFSGPDEEMRMYVEGAPVDSSTFSINTSGNSKQKGQVNFIVWRQYGREMNLDSLAKPGSNLVIDLNITANPLLKVNVILDELSGDVISALGSGNLRLHTATNENMTLVGRYNINRGNYNFNFQDIFKKPFTLDREAGSYISWTGDPYNAEINIFASYLAEQVRMSTLFADPSSSTISGVSSDVLKELSDVQVVCHLVGTLSQPNPTFQIVLPANSTVRNNPSVDSRLKSINRDPLEASKQSTYLIVFKSFAPQDAIVASDLNSELINNTISGVINSILASSIQNFFYKLFGSAVDVNFNYSRVMTDITGTGNTSATSQNNYRENVSLQFIKSLLDDKLVITFGSDFNFSTANSSAVNSGQTFLFLPDVNVEYKITPDGRLRTSFFYRSSFDALSTSGRRDRTGGNLSYRTEFDNLIPRKKKSGKNPVDRDPVLPVADTVISAIIHKQ